VKAEPVHHPVNNESRPGHIAGSFQKGEADEEQHDVGQKDEYASHARNDSVNQNGAEHLIWKQRRNSIRCQCEKK